MNHIQHHHIGTSGFCHVKVWLCFALVLLVASSCRNPAGGDSERGGPGLIIPGESIEGVKLGDSREEVEAMLGSPSNTGWADGLYRSHYAYSYYPPGIAGLGLSIYFIIEEDHAWGPVDVLTAHAPYEGRTPEGLGIGSSLYDVREAYGKPDFSSGQVFQDGGIDSSYTYCIDDIKFYIGTVDDSVDVFSISPFVPYDVDHPEDYGTSWRCDL